jgi:hypothetical protein
MAGSAIWPIDPKSYSPHRLHNDDRIWIQSNCYVDLWIEVLHTMNLDPFACCSFALGVDFEGDQWTFFKPPLSALHDLYGIDVQELNIWDSLSEQVTEQVRRGRLVITEADAYYLPDTVGLSYGLEHAKTAVAIQAIDLENRRAGYFHNSGYYELTADDFDAVLHRKASQGEPMSPYVEFAKLPRQGTHAGKELVVRSVELACSHVASGPRANPFLPFKERFLRDLEWLAAKDLPTFHRYAFATLRQCGAAYELSGLYLRWLTENKEPGLESSAEAFSAIALDAKALMFKTARLVNSPKKPSADYAATLDRMASSWDTAYKGLPWRA